MEARGYVEGRREMGFYVEFLSMRIGFIRSGEFRKWNLVRLV